MTAEDAGVTLPEINRNVIDLRRQLETMTTRYVPLVLWEENRKNIGERIGGIEKEVTALRAEKQQSQARFQTSFLYPLLMLAIGAGVGALIQQAIGG